MVWFVGTNECAFFGARVLHAALDLGEPILAA